MSSTTTVGGHAAPSGNSLLGAAPSRGQDPGEGYRPERYAAPTQVARLPELIGCEVPRAEYPEEARRAGFEGDVRLRLLVDEEGRVREVRLVHDPGHGLGAHALRSAKRYCQFRPAWKDGQAVATEIPFTLRFELR
jgi:protein TonB